MTNDALRRLLEVHLFLAALSSIGGLTSWTMIVHILDLSKEPRIGFTATT